MSTSESDSRRRWPWWLLLLAVIGAAIAVTAIPVFVIMPFKAQTSAGVAWSYWLRRLSPIVTVVALLLSFGLIYRLWSGARWYGRAAMFLLLAPLGLVVWFARQNHFEWLFNPLPNAAYAPAAETTFVPETDMVLGVELNGEAVAYPVRQMAYHHVVNDVVGGKPITATY
jgi:MFS family permease